MAIRIVVIEDHPLMLKAIINELVLHADLQVVGRSSRGSELMQLVREKSPDIVILDLGMTDDVFEPISSVKALLLSYSKIRLIILTGYNDRLYMQELIKAGAAGYILKSDDFSMSLPMAVRSVYKGERYYSPSVQKELFTEENSFRLAPQELSVLRLVSNGYSNEAIGEVLNISEKRVRNILTGVYTKLAIHENQGVNARVAVINKAKRLGLLVEDHLV